MTGLMLLLNHRQQVTGRRARIVVNICLILTMVCLLGAACPVTEVSAQSPQWEAPLLPVWQTTFPGEQSIQAMLAEDGVIYLLTGEGVIHALAAGDGRSLWQTSGWLAPETKRCPYDPPQMASMSGYSPTSMPGILLALDGDVLVAALCAGWEGFSTDQQLLLLDRMTGQLRGSLPVIGGRLMNVQNGVAVISSQEGPYAVALPDGQEVWRIEPEDKYNFYFMGTLDGLAFTQVYDENYKPIVSARSITDGTTRWMLPPAGKWSFKTIANGVLFAFYEDEGTYQSDLRALDPQNGAIFWQAELGALSDRYSGSLRLAASGDRVYAYSDSQPGGIVAFDAATGAMAWTAVPDLGIADMQVVANVVYCVGDNGQGKSLYALSDDDGQVIWTGLPGSGLRLAPVLQQRLFIASAIPGVSGDTAVLSAFQERR